MKHNVDEADLAMAYNLNVVENIKCYSLHVYSSKKKKKNGLLVFRQIQAIHIAKLMNLIKASHACFGCQKACPK